eukprot:gene9318-10301_t
MEYHNSSKNTTSFHLNISSETTKPQNNGTLLNTEPQLNNILMVCLYSVISLVGILGNGYVCVRIVTKSAKISHFTILLISLASADLLSCLVSPIALVHDLITLSFGHGKWYLGDVMCVLLPALTPMLLAASTWTLVVISIERFRVVAYPVSANQDKILISVGTLLVVWTSAACLSVPMGLTWRMEKGEACMETSNHLSDKQQFAYLVAVTIIIWVIPCFILTFVYTATARQLKASQMQHADDRAVARTLKQTRRIVRMFVILVVLFSLLSLPYAAFFCAIRYIKAYRHDLLNSKSRINELALWNTVLFTSCLLNSAINPIFYAKIFEAKRRRGGREQSCCDAFKSKLHAVSPRTRECRLSCVPASTATTAQVASIYRHPNEQSHCTRNINTTTM